MVFISKKNVHLARVFFVLKMKSVFIFIFQLPLGSAYYNSNSWISESHEMKANEYNGRTLISFIVQYNSDENLVMTPSFGIIIPKV